MIRCGLVESDDAAMARFCGGLNREIQDILVDKDYDDMTTLFAYACKAEREVQGRRSTKYTNPFAGRSSFSSSTAAVPVPAPSKQSSLVQTPKPAGATPALLASDHAARVEVRVNPGNTDRYESLVLQRVLSSQVAPFEKNQRHTLFHTKGVVQERSIRIIIDNGSYHNLASTMLVEKLSLPTRKHLNPYHIQWLNDGGKLRVTKSARVPFSMGPYSDFVDCDVIPMEACSLLLGRPWQYDTDCLHHGRSNIYSFMFKGQKIVLHPMTPEQIVKDDLARATKVSTSPKSTSINSEIKLDNPTLLVARADFDDKRATPLPCSAPVCSAMLVSPDDTLSMDIPLWLLTLLQDKVRHPGQILLFPRHPRLALHRARGRPHLQRPRPQVVLHSWMVRPLLMC